MSILQTSHQSLTGNTQKNYIINGNFDYFLEGDITGIANDTYGGTLLRCNKVGAVVQNANESSDVPTLAESGFQSSSSFHAVLTTPDDSLAAGDYCTWSYIVEGFDYSNLVGKYATLSFWVKATTVGTYCVSFRNSGTDRSYVVEFNVDTTETWEKKTMTVPMTETGGTWDYINGAGLIISWCQASGTTFQGSANQWQSGNYFATSNQVNGVATGSTNFKLAQIMLNEGEVAAPFSRAGKDISEELSKIQRYLLYINRISHYGYVIAANYDQFSLTWPTTMRATPTLKSYSVNSFNAGSYSLSVYQTGGEKTMVASATGPTYAQFNDVYIDARYY